MRQTDKQEPSDNRQPFLLQLPLGKSLEKKGRVPRMGDTKEHIAAGSSSGLLGLLMLAEVQAPDMTWQKPIQLVRVFRDQA